MIASSTSATVSVAWSADVTPRSRTVAQPTPMRPWRGSPESNPTQIATSAGETCDSSVARIAVFSDRLRVAATASDASTTVANRTPMRMEIRLRAIRFAGGGG